MVRGKKSKSRKGARSVWVTDPRLCCLGSRCRDETDCPSFEDVHDVDIMPPGESMPYRTRLCSKCRDGVEVVFDRGDVNIGKEKKQVG